MRKLITILMSLLLAFCLAACGKGQQAGESSGEKSSAETMDEDLSESEKEQESAEQSPAKETKTVSSADAYTSDTENVEDSGNMGGKTLVVYYSASGNTEEVANYIATATGGDVFELEPSVPYTDADLDWTNEDSRVCREHENEDERNVELVSDTVPDWDSYETVFIGYPIWWGIAAWPVDGFITANDFTGKTVIPFCTSASSGLGESGELLSKLAGTGQWQEGERFQSGASQEEVKAWIENLGL